MGVEVSWRDIKKACNALSPLGVFIRELCHFIATDMSEEHMKLLEDDSGVPIAFRQLKCMWDQVQDMHSPALSCCIVIESYKHNGQHAYLDLMAEAMGAEQTMRVSTSRLR